MITKILPNTNIKPKSGACDTDLSIAGVVAMALPLHWSDQVTAINAGDNTLYSLGCKISDSAMKLVREVANGAEQLVLYRLNTTGVKISVEVSSSITTEVVLPGTHGNDLLIVISASGKKWLVKTCFGTREMGSQTVSTAADFSPYYVAFSGTETLAAAIVKLTGSTNGAVESDYIGFFAELGKREHNVICSTSLDRAAGVVSFVRGQNANEAYVQDVVTGIYPDNENIYACSPTGDVATDYKLMPTESCAILAGLIAQAGAVNSLTYSRGITGQADVESHLTCDQQISRAQNGEVLFVPLCGSPPVLYDITSLTTFDGSHPKDFGEGLVIRAL